MIKIFEEANDILRKDGLSEGRERFTEFSNLLFLKLISDIEKHREEIGEYPCIGREIRQNRTGTAGTYPHKRQFAETTT